jgi:hypothetical protein
MDLGLKHKSWTLKLLKENIRKKFHREKDMGLDNYIYIYIYIYPKAQSTEAKIDKLDGTKLKSFFTSKETINKVETTNRQRKYLQTIYLIRCQCQIYICIWKSIQ